MRTLGCSAVRGAGKPRRAGDEVVGRRGEDVAGGFGKRFDIDAVLKAAGIPLQIGLARSFGFGTRRAPSPCASSTWTGARFVR